MKFWRQRKDDGLDAGIRNHPDEAIRIARGEAPDDARDNALREFGNVGLVKEVTREMWGWAWLERLGRDFRFGLRMLRKNPGFSLIATLTLALGIGANTAIFSVINGVLMRPLPFAEADQLVMIWETRPDVRDPVGTYPDFLDWRAQTQSFQGMAGFSNKRYGKAELTGDSETIEAQGMLVSQDLFPLLGLKPILGRNFLPEEEQSINNRVVILGQSVWHRGFTNDPGIIGRSIQLNGASFTVVGVMGAQYPLETDFWLPLSLTAGLLFEVRATDPLTFTVIALLLLAVALLACYLPARRATKVDPMIALRHE